MWFYFNRSIIKGLLNNFRLFIDGDTKMSENYQKQKKFALSLTAQQIQEYITSIPNKIDKSSIVQNLLPENLSEEKVPSSRALQDSLDKVTENFDTSSKVNEKVYQNIARAFGLNYVGTFKDGFTYTLETDVAVDSNGDFWRDKTGNLPRTIPDSSTPNQVDYFKVELSKNRNLFQELLVTTSLLTTLGSSTLDSLLVGGGQLVLDEVHFGEAVYSPTTTSMSSTTYIAKVDGVTKNFFNASQVIVDVNIPSDIGGFNFSEIAILDDHSRIAFMGKVDLFQKVEKINSVGVNLTVRLYLNLTNQAHVDIITGTKPETYISENEPPASYARWWIPSEGKAYIRYNDGDSVQWVQEGSSSGGSDGGYGRTIVSETRPNSVFEKSGQRWWIPSQLKAFIWYDDGDSGQWIQETISDSTGGSDATIISSTKPDQSYEQSGRRWWNPTTGLAYIWYEDGDSGQWVQENNSAPPMQRHNDTIDRNSVGSHDDIYVRTRTLAEALAEDAPVGTRYTITDLANARYNVVEANHTGSWYKTGLTSGRKLELIPSKATSKREINMAEVGLVDGGDINSLAQQIADYLYSLGGGKLVFDFGDFIASGQTTLRQGVSVLGQGIGRTKIAATSAMTAGQSIFYCSEPFSDVNDISLLCNSDGTNGAGTGVHTLGADHDVSRTYVSNSTQAGIRLEDPVRVKAEWCRLESCGRDGYTDNHGIMAYTTKAITITDISIGHCNIANTFRKGITTAVFAGGTLDGMRIYHNTVYGSGLGNIYIGGINHYNVEATHNICYGSPIGMQIQLKKSKVNFNVIKDTSDDFGIGGYDLDDVELIGNTTENTALAGIKLFSPAGEVNRNVRMHMNTCKLANRRNMGAPSIELVNTSDSIFGINTLDDSESPLISYGIYEHDNCNNNKFLFNEVKGAIVDKYRIAGADSTVEYADSSDKHKQLTLADGSNNDVNVTLGAGSATITGPTANYTVTGITGGRLGRTVKLVNSTAFTMTLAINSGASAAGNRLYLTNSVDKVVPAWGAVELSYLEVQGGQFWMDV